MSDLASSQRERPTLALACNFLFCRNEIRIVASLFQSEEARGRGADQIPVADGGGAIWKKERLPELHAYDPAQRARVEAYLESPNAESLDEKESLHEHVAQRSERRRRPNSPRDFGGCGEKSE